MHEIIEGRMRGKRKPTRERRIQTLQDLANDDTQTGSRGQRMETERKYASRRLLMMMMMMLCKCKH